ncbi:hypothetical protein [Tsukamurella soli]|uniref:hypothetical protein n=1 Tax=Tsukamurella soli TaxID=644556 RepID=UPI0031E96736
MDDSYPYQILSIRSNDGTYEDHRFAQNYTWMRAALDSGKLTCGIVYCYWRTDIAATFQTMQAQIDANGGLHPKVILMVDLESGGNPDMDETTAVDGMIDLMAGWTGDYKRVVLYANRGDFYTMWASYSTRLPQIGGTIGAGYGSNPQLPGQIAHQYTDGQGDYGQGLPYMCAPFGACDMNVADNQTAEQFAAACGVGGDDMTPEQAALLQQLAANVELILQQLAGASNFNGWPEGGGRTLYDLAAATAAKVGVPNTSDTKAAS